VRIPAAFLAEELRTMGARWYRRSTSASSLMRSSGVFDRASIERAFTDDIPPLKID
jgi:hypothetical protein